MIMVVTQFPPEISVANLNGKNGFSIVGFPVGSSGGYSVSNAGDVNGDGRGDLIVGVSYYQLTLAPVSYAYIVFSELNIGNSGTFNIASLNGTNGFIVTGKPIGLEYGDTIVEGIGDINNDGIDDVAIGVPGDNDDSGAGYVIFGKSSQGSVETLDVSALDGSNGFAISGFGFSAFGGTSISGGDINGDGIADLVIGAPGTGGSSFGNVYVIFGNVGVGGSGSFSVSSLMGSNGFTIGGFAEGDEPGTSVAANGDINADGINDLLMGEPGYGGGRVYVIFGASGIGNSGSLSVSSLTGQNGFIITNFPINSAAGTSVCVSGDLNGDGIDDFAIGAPNAYEYIGICYVVFGKFDLGGAGSLDVSTLNGSNGFIFTGFVGGGAGYLVSGIGDINHDGMVDLLIVAPTAFGALGARYVVFGQVGIGAGGSFDISSLDGANGFIITGIGNSRSASGLGDFNADGIEDLVIGWDYSSTGSSVCYVVFGDAPTTLIHNSLIIQKGQTQLLNNVFLNATWPFRPSLNQELEYSITNIQHGYFRLIATGNLVTSFTQQQINVGQIQFVHDDSVYPPSYAVSVNSGGYMVIVPPQLANITFIHLGPQLITNALSINQGQTLAIGSTQLSAIDLDQSTDSPSLLFTVSLVIHGQFNFNYAPGVPITKFSQLQLQTSSVQFVADGSINPPSYWVTVSDGGITTSPEICRVSFNRPPVLVNNMMNINQGMTAILSATNFNATDPDNPASGLIFIVSNIQHGHFTLISNPGTVISSFIQGQVQGAEVQFIPDGSANSPQFSVAVSDGRATTVSQNCNIIFNLIPILVNNNLRIGQGETIAITTANFNVMNVNSYTSVITFIINQLQYARFQLVSNSGMSVSNFTLAQVVGSEVQFVHDGSSHAPSFYTAVRDGTITTLAQPCSISFNAAPVIINNHLSINQGQSVIITPGDLSASDEEVPASSLLFTADEVMHGHFEDSSQPGVAVKQFLQQRILNGALHFVVDGSSLSPAYNITVSDGYLSSASSAAIVNFTPLPTLSENSNTIRNAIIGGTISGVAGLLFLILKLYLTRKTNQTFQKILEKNVVSDSASSVRYDPNIIRLLANKIFDQIRTVNIFGYRNLHDTKAYLAVIKKLLEGLIDAGVELSLEELSAQKQNRLFNEVVYQIRFHSISEKSIRAKIMNCRFFKSEITPKQFEGKIEVIVQAVAQELRYSDATRRRHIPNLPAKDEIEMGRVVQIQKPFEKDFQTLEENLDEQDHWLDESEAVVNRLLGH